MKKILITLIVLLGLLNQILGQSQNALNDTITLKLKKVLKEEKDKYRLPSIVIAIVHDQKIVFVEALGYADLENKIPATIDTKYPIMSVTKTFTATMLMQLIEKGLVDFDDDIRDYIPEYKVQSDFGDNCSTTLMQLATHKSGLPRNSPADTDYFSYSDSWYMSNGTDTMKWFVSNEKLLNSLPYVKLEYPPYHFLPYGRHYSNLGYSLLGIALERASKIKFTDYIKENICDPLEMKNSGFLSEPEISKQIASGYAYTWASDKPVKTPMFKPNDSNSVIPPGGMYSTARDMAKYISFQFRSNSHNEQQVLASISKSMMHSLDIGWSSRYYSSLSLALVTHDGAFLGYRSHVAFNPEKKIGWIVFLNSNNQYGGINFFQLNSKIGHILKSEYINKDYRESKDDLLKYVGTYTLGDDYGSINIYFEDDNLFSSYLKDILTKNVMIPNGDNSFIVQGNGDLKVYYKFSVNKDKVVKSLKIGPFVWYKE